MSVHFKASDTVIDKAMMILRVSGLTESLQGVASGGTDRVPWPLEAVRRTLQPGVLEHESKGG